MTLRESVDRCVKTGAANIFENLEVEPTPKKTMLVEEVITETVVEFLELVGKVVAR